MMGELDKALTKRVLKCNLRSWHELNYDEIHSKPYLIGKRKETDKSRFVYVMDPNKRFRFNFLKKIVTDTGSSSVLLNIHGSDSSSVYYKLHTGLIDLNNESDEESNEKDSNRSEDEMSDEESSEEEVISEQDSCLETSEQESSDETSSVDSCNNVSDDAPSPQTITISD